jgi:hypothetical protein
MKNSPNSGQKKNESFWGNLNPIQNKGFNDFLALFSATPPYGLYANALLKDAIIPGDYENQP